MTSRALAVFLLAFASVASAQTSVRGRVVSDTGVPLRNAMVSQNQTVVRTDADGRFAIDAQSFPPLAVTKGGFVRQSFPVVPGEILVTMARGGALTVLVIDASGKPVAGARVALTCNRASASGSPTDDRGQRRFAGLAPGRCEVSAGEPEGPPALTPPRSAEELAALSLEMRARAERQRTEHLARAVSVDIRAGDDTSIVLVGNAPANTMPIPVARGNSVISGTILDEFGEPAEEVFVQVQPANGDSRMPPQLPPQLMALGAGSTVLAGMAATTDDRGLGLIRLSGQVRKVDHRYCRSSSFLIVRRKLHGRSAACPTSSSVDLRMPPSAPPSSQATPVRRSKAAGLTLPRVECRRRWL